MNEKRLSENQRPKLLERDLLYFESLLSPLEVNEIEKLPICEEPIVFIMGCARSGTTLVYQYLAHSKVFYLSNEFSVSLLLCSLCRCTTPANAF